MVVGKRARVKTWIAGQTIESFSDVEGNPSEDGVSDETTNNEAGRSNDTHNRKSFDIELQYKSEAPTKNWVKFEELAWKSTRTSKTSVRTAFLNKVLVRHLEQHGELPELSALRKPGPLKFHLDRPARRIDVPAMLKHLSHFDLYLSSLSRRCIKKCGSQVFVPNRCR